MAFLRIVVLVLMGMNVSFARSTQFSHTLNCLRVLDGAVEQYRIEHKRLPTEAEGLVLVTKFIRWGGIAFDKSERPVDLWGNPFVYRCPGAHSTNEWKVYSMGTDGVSKSDGNDPDDINLWDDDDTRSEKHRKYYGERGLVWPKLVGSAAGFVVLWLVVGEVWTRWKR